MTGEAQVESVPDFPLPAPSLSLGWGRDPARQGKIRDIHVPGSEENNGVRGLDWRNNTTKRPYP